jgi:hypothetical protein
MKKALAGIGALLLVGALGTGCEPKSKLTDAVTRANAAATRAEDASRRAEAGTSRAEAACAQCGTTRMRK